AITKRPRLSTESKSDSEESNPPVNDNNDECTVNLDSNDYSTPVIEISDESTPANESGDDSHSILEESNPEEEDEEEDDETDVNNKLPPKRVAKPKKDPTVFEILKAKDALEARNARIAQRIRNANLDDVDNTVSLFQPFIHKRWILYQKKALSKFNSK